MRSALAVLMALGVLVVACTSNGESSTSLPVTPSETIESATPSPRSTAVESPSPTPTPTSTLTLGIPDLEAAQDVDPAPLGTFVVAREGAGIMRTAGLGQAERLEIPVYETPFGPPRRLLDVNELDAVSEPVSLTNWSGADGALVMRVVAGGPEDDWLIVQAPTRPNNSYVWVRRNDFDFGFTDMRIEIDLANAGSLTVFDGTDQILQSAIVQGRDTRPTPTHLTYIERGVRASSISPAYGTALVSMASFSEVLSTFGGGGLPSNFLHGTNQPELMGQRVSSGSIRLPNDVLDQIIETVLPGTPVVLFDSSVAAESKETIVNRVLKLATTLGFVEGGAAMQDASTFVTPQLWSRCPGDTAERLLCRTGVDGNDDGRYAFITALPDAGEFNDEVGANVVAVYDTPGGEPRMLVHVAPDSLAHRVALANPTVFGQPLVLWPLEVTPDQQWIRVQAPTAPQRRSVWVRADDFEFGYTDYRIEIDIEGQGNLTLFDGDTELISNLIVSGRESRPTPLGATYIDQVVEGPPLTPAYGPYVLSTPIYNEELSTFGGGALAQQIIHGTNQPELMGQRVASGHIRLPNEVLSFIVEQPGGLVGARVVTVDSTGVDRDWAIEREESRSWSPAETTEPDDTGIRITTPRF